jgi:tripartite-type tricarboxylate transporter receptor subunit TctC
MMERVMPQFKPAIVCLASVLTAVLALLIGLDPAAAQDFPARRITLLVGYAAGGPTDVVARVVADKLGSRVHQPVVVENRIGGGPLLSFESVKAAQADGYTLAMATAGLVSLKFTSKAYTLDPLKDFSYVIQLTAEQYPLLLLSSAGAPFKTLADFIAYARSSPGKINFGSAGTSLDLDIGLLASMASFKVTVVPYKGSSPQQFALATGEVDAAIDGYGLSKANLEAGKIRLLAVGSPQRIPPFPDTPAIAEAVPGYVTSRGWLGIIGPAGLPSDILARLNEGFRAAVRDPDQHSRLNTVGVEPVGGTPAEFRTWVERELDRLGQAANVIGMKPQ